MQRSKPMLTLAVSSLLFGAAAAASTEMQAEPRWQIVPEQQLAQYRGGIDLGPLVASFTIQRTIEVDGVVVASMQIVISHLDNLGNGGAPTVSVSGPVAELVQIMDKSGVAAAASAAQTLGTTEPPGLKSDTSPALNSDTTGSGLATNGQATPGTISAGGNGGSVVNGGEKTGSSAQFGNALNTAIGVANSALSGTSGSSGSPGISGASPAASPAPVGSGGSAGGPALAASGSSSPVQPVANSPAITVASNVAPASGAGSTAIGNAPASNTASGGVVPAGTPIVVVPATVTSVGNSSANLVTSKTVALGNTGQVAVLSNLPNASAITTAVQNDVRGATIQAQTTISATLNSLGSLSGLNLANQIRQQVAGVNGGGM